MSSSDQPRSTYRLDRMKAHDLLELGERVARGAPGGDHGLPVAQRICSTLYATLVDEKGDPATLLVRFYRTCQLATVAPDIRELAHRSLPGAVLPSTTRCLVLDGSRGARREWNDVSLSRNHRIIPLPTRDVIVRLPMVARLLEQLGVDTGSLLGSARGPLVVNSGLGTYNVFHVEQARGSPYIPAQEDFVIPEGVASVVGFGGILPDGEVGAVICFSRIHIAAERAPLFELLSPALGKAFAAAR